MKIHKKHCSSFSASVLIREAQPLQRGKTWWKHQCKFNVCGSVQNTHYIRREGQEYKQAQYNPNEVGVSVLRVSWVGCLSVWLWSADEKTASCTCKSGAFCSGSPTHKTTPWERLPTGRTHRHVLQERVAPGVGLSVLECGQVGTSTLTTSQSHQWAWGGQGRTAVDSEGTSGCLCASRAFWVRQTLEAFSTYVVKNTFQKHVYYTRQKATTGLWREHDPASTWMGPSVRSKHDGWGKIEMSKSPIFCHTTDLGNRDLRNRTTSRGLICIKQHQIK